jgi:hypothetical protein
MYDRRTGREERLRDDDTGEIISFSILNRLYCYQVCKNVMIRESHAHADRDRLV